MNKGLIESIIKKYYLSENESVKWVIKDNSLSIDFTSQNKDLIGSIKCNNVGINDCELAIFDTKKLLNLISICSDNLDIYPFSHKSTFNKIHIKDENYESIYHLADPILIKKPGTVNVPKWDVIFNIQNKDILSLLKAKSALSDSNNLLLKVESNLQTNKSNLIFHFGDENGYNNKIMYNIPLQEKYNEISIPFSSNLVGNILKENKDSTSSQISIFEKGLMKMEFKIGDIESTYYIVRLEINN
jgi:hypothetical protein